MKCDDLSFLSFGGVHGVFSISFHWFILNKKFMRFSELSVYLNKTRDWALVQNAALVGVGFSLG